MRFGRISKAAGIAAVAALALSACAGNSGNTNSSASTSGKTGGSATVVEVNGFTSFNSTTPAGNVEINSKIAYATHSGFGYVDDKLNVVNNDKFGKIEKVSDDPLTVKYTVNDGVKWSDNAPVDVNDLVLAWAIGSGYYSDSNPDAKTGNAYFQTAADTAGLNLTSFPELGSDGRSMTIKYSKPYADWAIALGIPTIDSPAHVLAQKAGLKDAAALTDLLKGLPKGDPAKPAAVNETLKKVSDFWNTGFDSKQLPSDASLFLSNGPYVVKSMEPDQSMTLVKNNDFSWGNKGKLDQITVRYIGSASAQIQALKNGEADIVAPQASADTVDQLKALAGQGVTMDKGPQLSYDHVDLNYSGVFADQNVREAFMKTIPRQDILNKIIKPRDPDAKVLDSQFFLPGQPKYDDSVKNNGSDKYPSVDIDGAKKLLNGATPTIRIMYNKDNPNRLDSFTLISQSASKAGFTVVDGGLGKSEWGKALGNGSYDASIFGWINPGVGVNNVPQVFNSGNGSNYNGFASADADKLMDTLMTTPDKAKQDDLISQIDKIVWSTGYGLPLFQTVGVDAYSDKVTGVTYNPTQTGVWWNVWNWSSK